MTNNINIPEKYQAAITEKKWQDYWEEHKTYAWDPHLEREENFVIDTPPPTISGHLHMGHVFSYTQTDFVARFFRMTGKNVFYPMGFDDNGLPTERLVEKERKVRAVNMDRNEFIAICEEVVEEAESAFRALFKSVALSVDWAQEYQTISSRSRNLSQASFLDLLKNEHVYRAMQPTLWDPIDQTALAQADVVDIESTTFMNEIIFKTGNEEEIRIATTRPELLPACVAVFYNPEDSRYLHLKDKQAITPLFGVSVPIMPDADVQIDKGTGLVMCCT
ncbi:MAG: valyl-tRNA synthetase, partial [Pseudomonadota bacterium]